MTAVQTKEATSSNPLLEQGFELPFDRIRPEHAEPAVDALIVRAREQLARLGAAGERGFAGFLDDLDDLGEDLSRVSTIVRHLNAVVSDEGWRAAESAILPKVSAFYTDLSLDEGLWQAMKTYAATDEARALGPVRARFLSLQLDEFRRGGADLPPEGRERLRALNIELAELTNRYANNTLDGVKAYELYVAPERLKGLPERVLEATAQDAASHGHPGEHRLTLHAPTYFPVVTYADDRALREELTRASNAVGIGAGRDNRELLPGILRLRRERAELLGYRTFADLVLEPRMAASGEQAIAFEADLERRTRPAFLRENAELEAFYRQHAGADAPDLAPWDTAYWAEKQRAALYDFDQEALRPYFPIGGVLSGLFEIARRVFGITVREAQAPGWHGEVRYYEIFTEGASADGAGGQPGQHIASFYTDWFPRDSKRGGAWMNAFRTGGPVVGTPGDRFVPHLGLMCGNMTPPSAGRPALLSHDEVETVFHEFGHLLHHALSRVEVRSLAGTNVAWDFVELPSQIMENWTWDREALPLFARHYQTGEPLPDELFAKMLAARNFRAANFAMRQYSLATMDLSLHVDYTPEDGDITAYARAVQARFLPVPPLPDSAFITNFGHLFSSPVGYAAGYYSYKWAEVLDADAFSRFQSEGVFNRETGRAFVDTVLSRGNSAPAAELFRAFMGRDPDAAALLRRSGLLESQNA